MQHDKALSRHRRQLKENPRATKPETNLVTIDKDTNMSEILLVGSASIGDVSGILLVGAAGVKLR